MAHTATDRDALERSALLAYLRRETLTTEQAECLERLKLPSEGNTLSSGFEPTLVAGQWAGLDVVVDPAMPPNTMRIVQGSPAPARLRRKAKPAQPAPERAIDWPRADPAALAKFDPASKVCNMNCGPAKGDPRSRAERLFLCDDC